MKLLELIVKNVKREDISKYAEFFIQKWFIDGYKIFQFASKPIIDPNSESLSVGAIGYLHSSSDIFGDDAATTIINREELMQAYDLVDQGYTLWFGGECPVDGSAIVDVVMRDYSHIETHFAKRVRWSEDGLSEDVIAYKFAETRPDEMTVITESSPSSPILCDLMRDISNSMPEMMAADMIELADYLIAQGWGKHE